MSFSTGLPQASTLGNEHSRTCCMAVQSAHSGTSATCSSMTPPLHHCWYHEGYHPGCSQWRGYGIPSFGTQCSEHLPPKRLQQTEVVPSSPLHHSWGQRCRGEWSTLGMFDLHPRCHSGQGRNLSGTSGDEAVAAQIRCHSAGERRKPWRIGGLLLLWSPKILPWAIPQVVLQIVQVVFQFIFLINDMFQNHVFQLHSHEVNISTWVPHLHWFV